MTKEKLKDERGRTIGYVETTLNNQTKVYNAQSIKVGEIKPQGNRLIAYNKMNQQIAYWDQSRKATFDKMGRKISNGNVLITLFFQ